MNHNTQPVIIVLGPTGSGKSSQAQLLATQHDWVLISSGDLERHSHNAEMIERADKGMLVKAADMEELMLKALGQVDISQGLVLDGFPRLAGEMHWLINVLSGMGKEISGVIYLTVSEEESIQRAEGRRRADDTPVVVHRRIEKFLDETEVVLDYFREGGLLTHIDGSGTREQVHERVEQAL